MNKNNYTKIAKSVIDLEINALKKLKKKLNHSFNDAVDAIVNCKSKVILCGVGKSGLMHQKFQQHYLLLAHPLSLYQLTTALTEIWEQYQKKIY